MIGGPPSIAGKTSDETDVSRCKGAFGGCAFVGERGEGHADFVEAIGIIAAADDLALEDLVGQGALAAQVNADVLGGVERLTAQEA